MAIETPKPETAAQDDAWFDHPFDTATKSLAELYYGEGTPEADEAIKQAAELYAAGEGAAKEAVRLAQSAYEDPKGAAEKLVTASASTALDLYRSAKKHLPEGAKPYVEELEEVAKSALRENKDTVVAAAGVLGGDALVASVDEFLDTAPAVPQALANPNSIVNLEEPKQTEPVASAAKTANKSAVDNKPAPKAEDVEETPVADDDVIFDSWQDEDIEEMYAADDVDNPNNIEDCEDGASSTQVASSSTSEDTVAPDAEETAMASNVEPQKQSAQTGASTSDTKTTSTTIDTPESAEGSSYTASSASTYGNAAPAALHAGGAVLTGSQVSGDAEVAAHTGVTMASGNSGVSTEIQNADSASHAVAESRGTSNSQDVEGNADDASMLAGSSANEVGDDVDVTREMASATTPLYSNSGVVPDGVVASAGSSSQLDARFIPASASGQTTANGARSTQSSEGDLAAVATNLDEPLENVNSGGEKGNDDDRGHDRSTEMIASIGDDLDAEWNEEIDDLNDDFELPTLDPSNIYT